MNLERIKATALIAQEKAPGRWVSTECNTSSKDSPCWCKYVMLPDAKDAFGDEDCLIPTGAAPAWFADYISLAGHPSTILKLIEMIERSNAT